MTDTLQVVTTTDREDEAERLAGVLLGERLAACVQVVGPITSLYWWQGTRERATEWLCVVKTTTALLDRVVAAIEREHSYDTPEITATPIVGGLDRYLRWIHDETR